MRQLRSGFTLIELLIVVVIIGILAAIAIPKFGTTKNKAIESNLRADLRNLATAQETYFSDKNAYATALADMQPTYYNPSKDVTITLGTQAGGWSATAQSGAITTTCELIVGGTLTTDGTPVCK